jgi:hypothetical protein
LANESLPHDDILSLKKLLAKATPTERQIILGWIIDTRQLIIALPRNKFVAWTNAIETLLNTDKIAHKELETLIG